MIGLLAMLLVGEPAWASKLATPANHAEWRWHVLRTEHVDVHFPTSRADPDLGAEDAARRIAEHADEIWLRMGDVLAWYPVQRIRVVVVDDTDDLKAWAWPLRGTVVISASPGTELARSRSRGDQLIDVFAHELAHVMIHKRMGAWSETAGFGVEGLGQLATGGVGVGLRLPVGPTVPQWWSEGGAEYLAARVGHGWWSPARDAGIRMAVLDERLLTWDELQVAQDKYDAGDGERAYQQGFAFFRWLEDTRGEDFFAELLATSAERVRLDPTHALKELTGERPSELYARHVESLEGRAGEIREERAALGIAEGSELWPWTPDWAPADLDGADAWEGRSKRQREQKRESTGAFNLYPQWSADGRWLGEHRAGWVRVRQSDEALWPPLSLDELDYAQTASRRAARAKTELWIPARFGSGFAFVPGRDAVVVSGPVPLAGPEDGDRTTQLYLVDLTPEGGGGPRDRPPEVDHLVRRSERIPGTERGFDPAISPNGDRLAFVRQVGGRREVAICALEDCQPETVPGPGPDGAVWSPSWSPDGGALVVAAHVAHRTDLWILEGGSWRPLTDDGLEQTDPWWAADGIYFAADVAGVHDVFRIDPATGETDRITRVSGMVATPSITPEGHLLFAHRTGHGWKSQALRREAFLVEPVPRMAPSSPSEVSWEPAPEPGVAEPYRVGRSTLPLAAAPEVRAVVEPSDAGLLAGGWLLTRDAAEEFALALHGLVGQDAFADGSLTLRVLPVDLSLWAGWEDDRRWTDNSLGRIRVQVQATGLEARVEPFPDLLQLWVEGQLRSQWLVLERRERLVDSRLVSAGARVGSADFGERIGDEGAVLRIAGAVGRSGPRLGDWQRVELDAAAQTGLGPTVVFAGASGGWVAGSPSTLDSFRAGGDAPGALRLGQLASNRSFVGFAPRSIAGTRLALLGAGLGLPVRNLRSRVGPIYLDDLEIRAGGDVGRLWTASTPSAPVLFDAMAEVRLAAVAGEQSWDSVLRFAHGFGEPDPTGDPTDPIRGQGASRIVFGLGTGW